MAVNTVDNNSVIWCLHGCVRMQTVSVHSGQPEKGRCRSAKQNRFAVLCRGHSWQHSTNAYSKAKTQV